MSDPRVAAIPVAERDEPLVDVRGAGLLVDDRRYDPAGAFAYLRRGVLDRLLRAQKDMWRAGCSESRTSGSGRRLGETEQRQRSHRAPSRPHNLKPDPERPLRELPVLTPTVGSGASVRCPATGPSHMAVRDFSQR